ncbi:type II toxin-antitoxin system Phd/YefM family antitoxin [Candidatus Hakubella thermalkaliphila]|uniref:Antitoxin n=1 Tax=Candidatus Hakubella thermalkaliphila TaxID=2754717 RepID=A0A6V8P0S9_9ACTN|nr:type II toxin-antitoxin system prevent-host-death family antitoxin [Candidatus Hakubella thermalkaliphila]GFP25071.1 hypothetical protein HKBW3S25_00521 [Candidatus Hakubella thermalkaliphila]GFP27050.1 hypothetical protein HKBW3S33_00462 [Candidatus Hakubella thermalkaliphila]
MKVITAKQLKNRTGEALRYVAKGEKVLVTRRGKPLAIMSPSDQEKTFQTMELRPFNQAWSEIEEALNRSEPFFRDWKEAINWSRKRR